MVVIDNEAYIDWL